MQNTRLKLLLFFSGLLVLQISSISSPVSLSLTIYNGQFAMVKDVRPISFDQGNSQIYFTDVSSKIQPETVTFKAVNHPGVRVYQQNFENNLVNPYNVLEKYLDKEVVVYAKLGNESYKITGTLLSHNGDYILKTSDGITVLNNIEGVALASLPEGFFTVPTLNWRVFSNSSLTTDCEVAYRTTGFSWKSDYSLTLSQDESKADIGGWVSIDNRSGKRYLNAKLKLIAGEVNKITPSNTYQGYYSNSTSMMSFAAGGSAPSFSEKSFSDFHIYTLSQPVTLNDNSQKQIEFIPKVYNVPVRKYNLISISSGRSSQLNLKASNRIEFRNALANGLGIPLPKGTFRVFKTDDSDGALEFIGEDSIDHTPKDENVTLKTGTAFDITANKVVTNYKSSLSSSYSADLNLTVFNHKATPAQIVVEFNTPSDNLKINWKSQGLNIEKVSSGLLRIKRTFKSDEKFSFLWSQNYQQ